jgi:uncharacterized membrane protein SirB2
MTDYTKEFFNVLFRWLGFVVIFCLIYCFLAFAAYFAEELTPINAQKFEYYILGLVTAEFFMRITKDD